MPQLQKPTIIDTSIYSDEYSSDVTSTTDEMELLNSLPPDFLQNHPMHNSQETPYQTRPKTNIFYHLDNPISFPINLELFLYLENLPPQFIQDFTRLSLLKFVKSHYTCPSPLLLDFIHHGEEKDEEENKNNIDYILTQPVDIRQSLFIPMLAVSATGESSAYDTILSNSLLGHLIDNPLVSNLTKLNACQDYLQTDMSSDFVSVSISKLVGDDHRIISKLRILSWLVWFSCHYSEEFERLCTVDNGFSYLLYFLETGVERYHVCKYVEVSNIKTNDIDKITRPSIFRNIVNISNQVIFSRFLFFRPKIEKLIEIHSNTRVNRLSIYDSISRFIWSHTNIISLSVSSVILWGIFNNERVKEMLVTMVEEIDDLVKVED